MEPNSDTANKFNEHFELILDFMGVLDHEPELWDKIKAAEITEAKMTKIWRNITVWIQPQKSLPKELFSEVNIR